MTFREEALKQFDDFYNDGGELQQKDYVQFLKEALDGQKTRVIAILTEVGKGQVDGTPRDFWRGLAEAEEKIADL